MEQMYSSNAKGNLGVALGAIGTGLGALSGSGMLGGILNGGANEYVNKELFQTNLDLIDAKKDNAILTADLASEKKMVEVFNAANDKINNVREELRNEIREVDKKVDSGFASQAIINTQNYSSINLLQSQVGQLFSLTKFGIPNSSLCPGYGDVRVTPTCCGTIQGSTTA